MVGVSEHGRRQEGHRRAEVGEKDAAVAHAMFAGSAERSNSPPGSDSRENSDSSGGASKPPSLVDPGTLSPDGGGAAGDELPPPLLPPGARQALLGVLKTETPMPGMLSPRMSISGWSGCVTPEESPTHTPRTLPRAAVPQQRPLNLKFDLEVTSPCMSNNDNPLLVPRAAALGAAAVAGGEKKASAPSSAADPVLPPSPPQRAVGFPRDTSGRETPVRGAGGGGDERRRSSASRRRRSSVISKEALQRWLPKALKEHGAGTWSTHRGPSKPLMLGIGCSIGFSVVVFVVMTVQVGTRWYAGAPFVVVVLACLLLLGLHGWGTTIFFNDATQSVVAASRHVALPFLSERITVPYDCLGLERTQSACYVAADTSLVPPRCLKRRRVWLCDTQDVLAAAAWEEFVGTRVGGGGGGTPKDVVVDDPEPNAPPPPSP